MAADILADLSKRYAHIRCCIVLAYMPGPQAQYPLPTLLPEGIEAIPPRYAIDFRNRWLVQHCDYAVCYITRSFGNAAKYARSAEKQDKKLIRIKETSP